MGLGDNEYLDGSEAYKLRREFSDVSEVDKLISDFETRYSDGYQIGRSGDWGLVGQGLKTNDNCGRFRSLKICNRVHLHNKVDLLTGVNYAGMVYVKPVFCSCDKPSCPVCFLRGWALKEARNIKARIDEGSKRYGMAYHIVVSVSKADYGLSLEAMRAKVLRGLRARGGRGGVVLFHAFRYANFKESVRKKVPFGWYLSCHFHVLGFIDDVFDKCRGCRFRDARGSRYVCKDCSGFYGNSKRVYLKDKMIVEVLPDRKSVFKTAFYQLSHASMRVSTKRSQVATWFGNCSYRELKVEVKEYKALCPICQKDLMDGRYSGGLVIVVNRNSSEFKSERYMDAVEGGVEVFSVVEGGSGSYGE